MDISGCDYTLAYQVGFVEFVKIIYVTMKSNKQGQHSLFLYILFLVHIIAL